MCDNANSDWRDVTGTIVKELGTGAAAVHTRHHLLHALELRVQRIDLVHWRRRAGG